MYMKDPQSARLSGGSAYNSKCLFYALVKGQNIDTYIMCAMLKYNTRRAWSETSNVAWDELLVEPILHGDHPVLQIRADMCVNLDKLIQLPLIVSCQLQFVLIEGVANALNQIGAYVHNGQAAAIESGHKAAGQERRWG